MAALSHFIKGNLRNSCFAQPRVVRLFSTQEKPQDSTDEDEFRVLNLRAVKQQKTKKREFKREETAPPRTTRMPVGQDWTAVWPGPRSFHPASVPLPIRQGYTEKAAPAPSKYANSELMKIPNFLHLTPPAIRQQCEALKRFCTSWPEALATEEKCKQHFPVDVVTTDYCHSLPTIRHPEARRVTIRIKLSDLKFDAHAKDKFLRLVGDRYNHETDYITIVADRCPMRKQNYDYAMYLLTASYHESFITEPWEATKSEADMEIYHFDRNLSKQSAESILNWGRSEHESKLTISEDYKHSVEHLINDGENEYTLNKYKEEVLKLLGLPSPKANE